MAARIIIDRVVSFAFNIERCIIVSVKNVTDVTK
jgi:hypothetical protein